MLFLGSVGFFAFCALVFEDCSNDEWHTVSSQEDAAGSPVAAKAERSEAANAPLLAARSEHSPFMDRKTLEGYGRELSEARADRDLYLAERDQLKSRLSLFHLDGGINDLLYEPGDDDAAQPLYWEDE